MPVWQVLVTGRVQGVGYRRFVLDLAGAHGVSGEVWNRLDGSVEAVLSHDDQSVLAEMAEALRAGPGRVAEVLVTPGGVVAPSVGFRIGPTRP